MTATAVQRAIERVPAPVLRGLARAQRPLARRLAARKYQRRHGGRFVTAIHPEDDLLHFSLEHARAQAERRGVRRGVPALRYQEGVRMYFEGGEWNAAEVEKVLADAGRPLAEAGSVLEFACGYGRLTRHLVHRIPPSRITVSDIDRAAVDFVRATFGVEGFYSAPTAQELHHDGRYDAIAVVSLFSHLPLGDWGPWLAKLHELLTPAGVLMFSTLGSHAFEVNVPAADRAAFAEQADGLCYRPTNETRGRLGADHYGTAYATAAFVERAVAEHFPGRLLAAVPRALNGFQDAYVLQRGA